MIEENNKERREAIIALLRQVSFNTKINIFSRLVKEFLPEFDLEKDNIPKNLNQTKVIRNLFAHSRMDLRDKFLDSNPKNVVQYEITKDGKTIYKKFTKKELKEYLDLASGLTSDLVAIDVYIEKKLKKSE